MRVRSSRSGFVLLAILTLSVALPFVGFLIFAVVTPDSSGPTLRSAAANRGAVASRPSPGAPPIAAEAPRKRRT